MVLSAENPSINSIYDAENDREYITVKYQYTGKYFLYFLFQSLCIIRKTFKITAVILMNAIVPTQLLLSDHIKNGNTQFITEKTPNATYLAPYLSTFSVAISASFVQKYAVIFSKLPTTILFVITHRCCKVQYF